MKAPILSVTTSQTTPEESGQDAQSPQANESADQQKTPMSQLFALDRTEATDEEIQNLVNQQVALGVAGSALDAKYNILVLFNEATLTRSAANRIYGALDGLDKSKPILLVLNTPGGDIGAAYFVAKLCREHTDATFEVAVPRRAKSAGTLICCGADRIHMGNLSELGPIDPQFGAIPALALKHSVEHIAELVGTYPQAKEMFSDYLVRSLRIESLGFFERVAVSAAQYAVRLLNARSCTHLKDVNEIAKHLVYSYKDHGFVIDSREANEIFGPGIVVCNTPEYQLSNGLYDTLDFIAWLCDLRFSRDFSFVGNAKQGCWVVRKKSE